MSRFGAAGQALVDALSAAFPTRVVARGFHLRENLSQQQLEAGHYSVSVLGPSHYGHPTSESGVGGATNVIEVVFQVVVTENATPAVLEDAELAALAELESLVDADLGDALRAVVITEARLSAGIEHPFGWLVVQFNHPIF